MEDEQNVSKFDQKINLSFSIRDIFFAVVLVLLLSISTLGGYFIGRYRKTPLQQNCLIQSQNQPLPQDIYSVQHENFVKNINNTQETFSEKTRENTEQVWSSPNTAHTTWMLYPNTESRNTVNTESSVKETNSGKYVASKNGEKYYPLDCGSANRIKPENKVFFDSTAEAERAGYTESQQCEY